MPLQNLLGDLALAEKQDDLTDRVGTVEANPDANTVLGRLKAIATSLATVIAGLGAIVTGLGAVVLAAGSAVIGRVGIDQTTPGTTNRVAIGNDGTVGLLAGAAVIGKVGLQVASADVAVANPVPIKRTNRALTLTPKVVPAAGSGVQLCAADATRTYVFFENTGIGDAVIAPGAAAPQIDAGKPLNAADAANKQGGSLELDGAAAQEWWAFSTVGTRIIVITGV